jgi:rRNA maturation endonuclease Nob1
LEWGPAERCTRCRKRIGEKETCPRCGAMSGTRGRERGR